ncbi:MAG: hypothetical protein KGI60_03610 [Patescibacteria group bacterium]|nr:hypothetical protein [Patescibacteria group bacterium]
MISIADAQTAPQFMVSWRALNYVPGDYVGKTFPSLNSPVEAGFNLINNGKLIDVSRYVISWYVDDNLVASGKGLTAVRLDTPSTQNELVRVVIGNYNGSDISDTFLVPVLNPEVNLSAQTPNANTALNRIALSATSHLFEARPFFFNAASLNNLRFTWDVNGQQTSGSAADPNFLSLDLTSQGTPQQKELTVTAGVSNLLNQLEIGAGSLNFVVQ